MGPGPTASVINETELGSIAGDHVRNFGNGIPLGYQHVGPLPSPLPDPAEEQQKMLKFFDHDGPFYGAIRDASWTEYNLCAIEITQENLGDFFDNLSNDAQRSSYWASEIQGSLIPKHAWRVHSEVLNKIELEWTGLDRDHLDGRLHDTTFIVNFALTSGLSYPKIASRALATDWTAWNIVHSLTFVAIAQDALDLITKRVSESSAWATELQSTPFYDAETVAGFFARIRLAPTRQSLAAAVYSTHWKTSSRAHPATRNALPGPAFCEPIWMVSAKMTSFLGLPHRVRRLLNPGKTGPSRSFLRCSSQNSRQPTFGRGLLDWPHHKYQIKNDTHIVLVSADLPQEKGITIGHCIFVIDPENIPHEVQEGSPTLSAVHHYEVSINTSNGGSEWRPRPTQVTSIKEFAARLSDFETLLRKIKAI